MVTRAQLKQYFETGDVPTQSQFAALIVGIGPSGEIIGTFASRVATQAALSSIVLKNGELAFASDSKDTFRGNGTTPGGLLVAGGRSITANFTVSTSSTALGTVISFPVVAGAVHRIKALLKFASAAATGNFQFQLNGTDGYSSGNMAGSLVSASHVINWRDPAGTLFSQSDVLLLPASSLAFLCPFTTVTSSICELEYTFTPGANGVMNLLVGQKTTDPTPSACQWVCEAERLR